MPFRIRLPFWSDGQLVTVTQDPGEGSHDGYTYYAWDFALAFGHRVRAVADGVVVDIRETVPDGDAYQMTADSSWGSGGIGNIVTLRHEIGSETFYSSYIHLRQNSVPVDIGQSVSEGQEIGQVGHTGIRTGAHLHFQVGANAIQLGVTNYGWPDGTENGEPQWMADSRNLVENVELVSFDGYGTSLPSQVIGPPPAATGLPDLIADNFTVSATTVKAGDALDFTWEVANIGTGDQTTTGYSGIYLSTDSTVTLDDLLLHDEVFTTLKAGDRDADEWEFGVVIPDWLAAGTYWIGVYVDNRQTVYESNGGNNLSNLIQITVTGPDGSGDVDDDFNGDGVSDILWRNSVNSGIGLWEMGGEKPLWVGLGRVSADWTVAATGDFDGDGTDDLFWHNMATGTVGLWAMTDSSPSWSGLGTVGEGWTVAAAGDFDGDGTDDLLWRDVKTGATGLWVMTGGAPTWDGFGTISLDWRIAGAGDFDGDGVDEFIWRNDLTGGIGTWNVETGSPDWNGLGTVGSHWGIAGIGDIDGDGDDDIFWRESLSGTVGIWDMEAGKPVWNGLGTVGADWQIAGTGDYDGNGQDEILWRNTVTGTIGLWEILDGSPAWSVLSTVSPEWEIA